MTSALSGDGTDSEDVVPGEVSSAEIVDCWLLEFPDGRVSSWRRRSCDWEAAGAALRSFVSTGCDADFEANGLKSNVAASKTVVSDRAILPESSTVTGVKLDEGD